MPVPARNDVERGATIFPDLATRFRIRGKAAGAIGSKRLMSLDTSGNAVQSTANDIHVIGANPVGAQATGDYRPEVAYGACYCIADAALTARQRIKAGDGGRVIQAVDSTLAGALIKTTGVGLAFGNQPANDGVEIVSSNAGDTTQTVTIIGTTQGTNTVVVETKALNGTTPVATTKTDWGFILAVKMSAVAAGTVTFREASGDLAITTLTAGQTAKGVETVSGGNSYNQKPTIVSDGATTKVIGLQGTSSAGAVIYDSKALNGTTAVTMNSEFKTVTEVYTGDLEGTRISTVRVGAEDIADVRIGRTLQAATVQGQAVLVFLNPR